MKGRVQKFRSVAEMGEAPFFVPGGQAFDRFARHCARVFALSPRTYPRGVFRFRSIEEAQTVRAEITAENMRANRARTGR